MLSERRVKEVVRDTLFWRGKGASVVLESLPAPLPNRSRIRLMSLKSCEVQASNKDKEI
jgi:hypothetical protein